MPGTNQTGQLHLLYVDTSATPTLLADKASATWTLIGGQRGVDFNRTRGTADVTTKDSNYWTESLATNKDAELTLDNLLQKNDAGIEQLRDSYEDGEARLFRLVAGDKIHYFMGLVTEFSTSAPQDDAATLSGTIKPTGEIEDAANS